MDHLMAAWAADPGMHVYHYAPYEPTKLKALSGRHATRGEELDRLLRGQRLVDLYAVVRQGIRIEGVVLDQELEDFYWGHARAHVGVSDALGSVVAFERWLGREDGAADQAILDDIRRTTRRTALHPGAARVAGGAARPSSRPRGRCWPGPCPSRSRRSATRSGPRSSWPSASSRVATSCSPDSSAGTAARSDPSGGTSSATRSSRPQSSSRTARPSATSGHRRSEVSSSSRGSGDTPSRRRTARSRSASTSPTSTPMHRPARSSRSTPPRGGSSSRCGSRSSRRGPAASVGRGR